MGRFRNGVLFEDDASHTATEVIEIDRDTFTGLYDHNGTPLHRPREPIGYQHDRWNTQMAKKPVTKKPGKGKGY